MEIGELAVVLHLYDAEFSVLVLCQYIHSVVFVGLVLLVALALKKPLYLKLLSYQ